MIRKIRKTMKVYELLNKKRIIMQLEKGSKNEIIKKLTYYLLEGVNQETKNNIMDAIMKRESIESTAIGNGIAIPHARVNKLSDFYIALGLSKDGVDFGAIDNKPVHIIFLVIANDLDKVLYIRVLARLARLLHIKEFKKGLLERETPEGVISFIKKYESF